MVSSVVFGAGKAGAYLVTELKYANGEYAIDAILDNFARTDTEICGVKVCRPDEYLRTSIPDVVFIAAGGKKALC